MFYILINMKVVFPLVSFVSCVTKYMNKVSPLCTIFATEQNNDGILLL